MFKPTVICSWDFELNKSYERDFTIYIDSRIDINKEDKSFKVALVIEPFTILNNYHNYLLDNYDKFDLILTYDTELLKLPNSKLFEFGTSWIRHNEYVYNEKKLGISTVVNRKEISDGHILRKELWDRQNEIKDAHFFRSYNGSPDTFLDNQVLGDSKIPLFDYQYSIVIENTKLDYYFSEKIIDCLLCKTIPIYYGANKISNYFDNIIEVNTCDDIIAACKNINIDSYNNSLNSIESNFKKAKKYASITTRLNKVLNKIK
jgi:hypothetical protein